MSVQEVEVVVEVEAWVEQVVVLDLEALEPEASEMER